MLDLQSVLYFMYVPSLNLSSDTAILAELTERCESNLFPMINCEVSLLNRSKTEPDVVRIGTRKLLGRVVFRMEGRRWTVVFCCTLLCTIPLKTT
jgi:hypothetical protein